MANYLKVFLKINLFIYLAVPGLSCSLGNLRSSLQHVGFLAATCKLLLATCGTYFPDQGLNLGPLLWECGVLATGPPGKSFKYLLMWLRVWIIIITLIFFFMLVHVFVCRLVCLFIKNLLNARYVPSTRHGYIEIH